VKQAELRASAPSIVDTSLRQSYPDSKWLRKAERAIGGSDIVIVIVGQDTHSAQGVLDEIKIANRLDKPIMQIRPQGKPYGKLEHAGHLYAWKWKTIDRAIFGLLSR
jgi:hypothetical protein